MSVAGANKGIQVVRIMVSRTAIVVGVTGGQFWIDPQHGGIAILIPLLMACYSTGKPGTAYLAANNRDGVELELVWFAWPD